MNPLFTRPFALGVALAGCAVMPATAVTTASGLDWLELNPTNPGELLDDLDAVTVSLDVQVASGSLAGSSPGASPLSTPFWLSSHDFLDSQTDNLDVMATSLHVLPGFPSLTTDFTLTLSGPLLSRAVLSIGQITSAGNAQVRILAFDAANNQLPGLTFLGQHAYDNGLQRFDGVLDWDSATQTLTPGSGNSNESGFGFFRLPGGPVSRVHLVVTDSASVPVGDVISIAVGIPEPGSVLLVSIAGLVMFRRSRPFRP